MKKIFVLFFLNALEFIGRSFRLLNFLPDNDKVIITVNDSKIEVSKEEYSKAIEKGELQIKDENTLVFKKPDYETRLKNIETEHYNNGKTAALEMKGKDLKKKYNIDIEGKDIDSIVEAYAESKVKAAKIPESEKLTKYEKDIDQLRSNLAKEQQEKADIQKQYETKEQRMRIDNALLMAIPEKAVNENMTRSDRVALFKNAGYDLAIVDGKTVVTLNGDVQKNTITLEPLSISEVISKFADDKKWIETDGGRGGKDDTGKNKPGSWEAFLEEMKGKGINPGTQKFIEEQQKRTANKTLQL